MTGMRKHRLSIAGVGTILHCMRKELIMTLTPEELYALELQARRARAAEVARLVHAGFRALRALGTRLVRPGSDRGGFRHA